MYIDNVRGVDQYGLDFHIITVPSMAVSSRFIVREKSSLDPRLTSDLLRMEGLLLLLGLGKKKLCSARRGQQLTNARVRSFVLCGLPRVRATRVIPLRWTYAQGTTLYSRSRRRSPERIHHGLTAGPHSWCGRRSRLVAQRCVAVIKNCSTRRRCTFHKSDGVHRVIRPSSSRCSWASITSRDNPSIN